MAVVAGSAGCAALASSVWVGGCVDRSAARARCLIVFWCEGAWSKSCWVFVWSRSCHALVQCFIVSAEAGSLIFGIRWALEDVVLRRFGGGVLQAGWGCLLWIEGILQVRLQPLGSYECWKHGAVAFCNKEMHQPEIEPGSHRWRRCILPLDH